MMSNVQRQIRLRIAKQFLDQAIEALAKNINADVDYDVWRAASELKIVEDETFTVDSSRD